MTADQLPQQAIEVRAAVPAELPAIRRLVSAAYAEFEPSVTPANWTRMSANIARVVDSAASGELLVAYLAEQLAGTVTYLAPGPKDYHRVPQEWAVIRVLGVDPALRGHGVARALTEACLARARADRAPAVGLHTAEIMTAARALYESVGFVHYENFTHLDIPFCLYLLRLS